MKEREKIHKKIFDNYGKIESIQAENLSLYREWLLLNDEVQHFSEQYEEKAVWSLRKKVVERNMVGRVHWVENYTDADTGDVVSIERSRVVRINGIWVNDDYFSRLF